MSEEAKEKNTPLDDTSSMIDSVPKPEKRYARNRRLALIGLGVFLLGVFLLGLSFFLALQLQLAPRPVARTAVSSLKIAYFFPDTLKVGMPVTFSVVISNSEIQFNATEVNQKLLNATPIPNGTPDVPLSQAFGPGYQVFAYAQLDVSPASKFDLPRRLRQDSQFLEQEQATFRWTITPKETTKADITVKITGQWKPIGVGNEIDIPLWEYLHSYEVSTSQPPIIEALTALGGALYALLPIFGGIGLTIPWIWDQIRKKRNKSKQSTKKRTQRGRKQG